MTQAYPLQWPDGLPRTRQRKPAPFKTTLKKAIEDVLGQVRLMGGTLPVLSSNLELRNDGLPYANQRMPADPGIALYFQRRGRSMTFACDQWDKAEHNIRAIVKTIEALRGIERWGSSDLMERAFSGFEALPPPRAATWRDVLGLSGTVTAADIDRAYRAKAATAHPDRGGSNEAMAALNRARAEAKAAG